jgi:hypothetical protein
MNKLDFGGGSVLLPSVPADARLDIASGLSAMQDNHRSPVGSQPIKECNHNQLANIHLFRFDRSTGRRLKKLRNDWNVTGLGSGRVDLRIDSKCE